MKPQLLIFTVLFCCCSKTEQTTPITTENKFPSICIPQGTWPGEITYTIPFVVENYTIPCPRTIKQITDSTFSIQWWSAPDTCDTIQCADTLRYTITLHKHNESCGVIDTWFIFHATGLLRNDSLIECGMVEYLYYKNNQLMTKSAGPWKSWAKL